MNEIIKYYIGRDIILELGKPHLIIVGQEHNNELECEQYILIENVNGEFDHYYGKVTSPNIENLSSTLEMFMKYHGLEGAENKVYFLGYQKYKETEVNPYTPILIQFDEVSSNDFLHYMCRKSREELQWVLNQTDSEELRRLIPLYRNMHLTVNEFR